jgi:hypothetical protein
MPGTDVDGLLRSGAASLCLAAGILHMSAAADHAGMATHVAFFVLVAVLQSVLGALVLWARPDRWLVAAAGANLTVAVVWVLSRTTGLPVGGTSAPEAIGFKDGISTVLELGVVASVGLWWLLPQAARQAVIPSRRLGSSLMWAGVWALGASGLLAGHTHSAGHSHGAAHAHGAPSNGDGDHGPGEVVGPHPHAGTGHDGDHAPDSGPLVTAAPHADGHAHLAGATHSPSEPGGHHAAGTRPALTVRHAPGHDHGPAHGETVPVPSQAAGHRHPGSADTHHGPDPSDGHSPAGGHAHDHGSGHDRPDDERQPRRDEDDNESAPSPLDEVLKLIRAD